MSTKTVGSPAATLTKRLATLASRRKTKTVTADDAQHILDTLKYRKNRTLIGSVLKNNFKSVGYTRSEVPSNRKRTIRVWKTVA